MARQPYSRNTRPDAYDPRRTMNRRQSIAIYGAGNANQRISEIMLLELRRQQGLQSQSRATPKKRK